MLRGPGFGRRATCEQSKASAGEQGRVESRLHEPPNITAASLCQAVPGRPRLPRKSALHGACQACTALAERTRSDPMPDTSLRIEVGPRPAREGVEQGGDASTLPVILPLLVWHLFAYAVLRNAWLGDDSFVTWRALDNLLEGHGWTSDPPQRVQGFTSVLWPLVVAVPYALGADIYWAAMGASLVCSLGTAALLLRGRGEPRAAYAACAAVMWLTLSSAYVDYSTSGLENPLAHLLLAVFFSRLIARRQGEPVGVTPFLLGALIGLTRHDHALLVLPALISLLLEARRAAGTLGAARLAGIGLMPLALWLAFATVYYGFPFPNTAYAKLTTDIPSAVLAAQGLWYAMTSLQRDPLTLAAIALAIALGLRERSRTSLVVALGLALYVAYVVRVGGDFMAGRFFTAPLLVALVWLAAGPFVRCAARELVAAGAIAGVLGLWMASHLEPTEKLSCHVPASGVVNERHCYFEHNALTQNLRGLKYRAHPYYQAGHELRASGMRVTQGLPGMTGFAAGPGVHLIDAYALTDPLLARLPFRPTGHWRIGHFPRAIPDGYAATLQTGRNVIADPCLHRYYEALGQVIRGPLFRAERFIEIVKLNTGVYDALLAEGCKRP